MAMTREMRRVTLAEVERGDAVGWQFEVGWFERASGLKWAWWSRTVDEENTDGRDVSEDF